MLNSIVLTSVILILNDSIHFISMYFTKTKFLDLWNSFLTAPSDLMILLTLNFMLQEEVPQNALQCGKRHIHRGTSYIDTNNTKNILEAVHMVVVNCSSSEPLPDSRFLTMCSTLQSYNITIFVFIYFTE